MSFRFLIARSFNKTIFIFLLTACSTLAAFSQGETTVTKGKAVYEQLKSCSMTGGSADVSGLVLKRDRVTMTFTGTFYFSTPVEGRVTTAVFVGIGTFSAPPPPSEFEKNNIKRLLDMDVFESDFKTAVLRFTDDTFDVIGKDRKESALSPQAQRLATENEARILKETGANLSARLALSVLNAEKAGFFFGNFDGGKLNRFSYVFDPQNRIPTAFFEVNGGEKGLIFAYRQAILSNEILLAFPGLEDLRTGLVYYSDAGDLVNVTNQKMTLDLRNPKTKMGLKTTISMTIWDAGMRAIPFSIGESLGESENKRLKKQLHIRSARIGSTELETAQEDWESNFTVFLQEPSQANQKVELEIEMDGDFLFQPDYLNGCCSYPRSNSTWYPRHGYLDRATFDLTFLHQKKNKIASIGARLSEESDPQNSDTMITRYLMKQPVALATFALGPFQRHPDSVKLGKDQVVVPLEFNSLSGELLALKEDFILAEMNNSIRYFDTLFGSYPYGSFSATFHPFPFGQGFPSMLVIPNTDRASKYTYLFISHEAAHQWWGNIVSWRSYRDQWLSEGFAEYSAILYTAVRKNPVASKNLISEMRQSLEEPPQTLVTSVGKGRLNDIGPLTLGHRLESTKSFGAYQALIYNKGALVLRMLHFLFSDPSSENDQAFFNMMKDFVEKYRNKAASTDDFRIVANQHFAKTPIAQRYRLTDLNWFFRQWVYGTEFPSYKLEYQIEEQPDGSVLVNGTVIQNDVSDNWTMPLPVVFTFGEGKFAGSTVIAMGPRTPFKIKLPQKPAKVELDPNKWILSSKTSTN